MICKDCDQEARPGRERCGACAMHLRKHPYYTRPEYNQLRKAPCDCCGSNAPTSVHRSEWCNQEHGERTFCDVCLWGFICSKCHKALRDLSEGKNVTKRLGMVIAYMGLEDKSEIPEWFLTEMPRFHGRDDTPRGMLKDSTYELDAGVSATT